MRKTKKLLTLLCALCLLFSAASCSDTAMDGETSESVTEAATTEPLTHLTLIKDGLAEYTLISPEALSQRARGLSIQLQYSFRAICTNGSFPSGIDTETAETPKEILFGKTSRRESLTVYEELEKSGDDGFAVRVMGEKLVIAGTTDEMLEKAYSYFAIAYMIHNETSTLEIPVSESYTEYVPVYDQPHFFLNSMEGDVIATPHYLTKVDPIGDYRVAQGACTDGEYIYIVMENQNVSGGHTKVDHYSRIVKVDAETLATAKVSDPLAIDHGNDLHYVPETNQLIVSHNSPNRTYLSYVDADTLTLTETVKDHELEMYGVVYHEEYEKYAVGISYGYDFAILDKDLNLESRYAGLNTGYTKQGMTCDDRYIYFLQYNENVITVHDWDGNYVRTITIEGCSEEPEGLFYINGVFYMTTVSGGAKLYRLDLSVAP